MAGRSASAVLAVYSIRTSILELSLPNCQKVCGME